MDILTDQKLEFEQEMEFSNNSIIPKIPSFDVFLFMSPPEYEQIGYWNVLYNIVSDYNIPYEILNGENENFYYRELERLLQDRKAKYKLNSLDIPSEGRRFLENIKQEYALLARIVCIMEKIFDSMLKKKWRNALIKTDILMDQLSEINVTVLSS